MASLPSASTPRHLRLTIRHQRRGGYRVNGDDDSRIGRSHPTGMKAEKAILEYCRDNHCTAFIQIYDPNGKLWREDTVAANGSTLKSYPLVGTPA